MQIDKKADFIMKNGRAIYPPVISDESLELYYDTKGKKNTDTHKDKLLDMSGNDRHGELQNFNYKNLSGYQEDSQLVFDGISDTLKMPKLNGIDVNNFTYQLNNNILAFTGDEVKTVKNGDVEVVGRNYLLNSDFSSEGESWEISGEGAILESVVGSSDHIQNTTIVPEGDYIFQVWYEVLEGDPPYLYNIGGSDASWDNRSFMDVNEGYSYVSITIRSDGRMPSIRYASGSPVGHLEGRTLIKRVKLEKGNKATDWTPAPEDLIETTELKGNILGDMEDIIDDHTRDEQSGVEVFTDKADDSLVRVEVDGKSYQSDVGRNITIRGDFSNGLSGWAVNGTVTSGNIDSMSVAKLTGTGLGLFQYASPQQVEGFYEISFRARSVGNTSSIRCGFLNSGAGASREFAITREWKHYTFRTSIVIPVGSLYHFYANNNTGEGLYITDIAVNSIGPSPDYPIEIYSLNDFDVVSSVGERNLLLNSKTLLTSRTNEIVNFLGREGVVKVSNPQDKMYLNPIESLSDEVNSEDDYVLSVDFTYIGAKGRTPQFYIRGYQPVEGVIEEGRFNRIYIRSTRRARIHMHLRGFEEIYLHGWKLEKGNKATDWTPAPEDITEDDNHPLIDKINLSLSEPLRSVGDVKDRLFRDDSDGLWKIERNVGEQVFENDDQWSTSYWYEQDNSVMYGILSRDASYIKQRGAVSFSHVPSGASSRDDTNSGVLQTDPRVRLRLRHEVIGATEPSPSLFKEWLVSENEKGRPLTIVYEKAESTIEILDQEFQDKLNNLRSFQDSNYVYTIINEADSLPSHISEKLKPQIHTKFLARDHFKENRTVNNLLIWNRSLEDEELLNQNKLFHERFNMRSNTVEGEPITQEMNLLSGGVFGHTLEQNYTIEI